jgi:hypothetical protein
MADEPKDMLAREIDEELRRERLLKLWDQYGTYILAAAVLIVGGVGGMKYYDYRQQAAAEVASTQYIIALRDFALGKPDDGQKALEKFIPSAPQGYATLARLRLAASERAGGSVDEALSIYGEVANNSSADPILADFARLQIASIKLDVGDFTDAKNRLTPLSTDKNAWRYTARELLGVVAYKSGRLPEAKNHFQRLLSDPTTPPGISERVKVFMTVMEQDEVAKVLPALDLLRSFEKSDATDGKTK